MRKNIPIETDDNKLKQSKVRFCKKVQYEDLNLLTHGHYAHNSLLSMLNDWNTFVDFCLEKQVSPLPASITAVRLFLEKQSQIRKFATIRRISLTLGLVHRLHQLPDPTNHRQIHFIMANLRQHKKDDAVQATAFTASHLMQLTQQLNPQQSIKDLRDLIIYHLMFECVLKRGKLRRLTVEDFVFTQPYQLNIGTQTYVLSEQLSYLLSLWFKQLGRESGILLCRIDKHGNLGSAPLNDSSIYRVFRRASALLGQPQHLNFSGQSPRVGAAQELHQQGYNLRQIQQIGQWNSPVMPAQYLGKHQLSQAEQRIFKKIKPWD